MREGKYGRNKRAGEFFHLTLSQDSLENYYRVNFALMQHHNYSLLDIENMMPWEREIYVTMLAQFISDENERLKAQIQQDKWS